MKIFISYSTKIDKVSQFAKELKTKLNHEPGVAEVFICEEDIPIGEVWDVYIARKVKDCDAFIPIITQEYLDSPSCHKEILDASYTYKKPIFSILIGDCKLEYENGKYGLAIRSIVTSVQYITFKTTKLEDLAYNHLLAAIKQKVLGVLVSIQVTQEQPTVETRQETSSGTSDILKSAPDRYEVLKLLADNDDRWNEIGIYLKVRMNVLKGLQHKPCSNAVKLAEVINTWIDSRSSPVTWETVISAIEQGIKIVTKANEIRCYLGLPEVNN